MYKLFNTVCGLNKKHVVTKCCREFLNNNDSFLLIVLNPSRTRMIFYPYPPGICTYPHVKVEHFWPRMEIVVRITEIIVIFGDLKMQYNCNAQLHTYSPWGI